MCSLFTCSSDQRSSNSSNPGKLGRVKLLAPYGAAFILLVVYAYTHTHGVLYFKFAGHANSATRALNFVAHTTRLLGSTRLYPCITWRCTCVVLYIYISYIITFVKNFKIPQRSLRYTRSVYFITQSHVINPNPERSLKAAPTVHWIYYPSSPHTRNISICLICIQCTTAT